MYLVNNTGWQSLFENDEKLANLIKLVEIKYSQKNCYPPLNQILNAFNIANFENIKVVILGQDPYHGPGQANGLSFSVNDGVKMPPSLVNIFKEINTDLGLDIPTNGNLERWAKQGVFLLNTSLTVEANLAGSHRNIGWEYFTDSAIKFISDKSNNVVFLLWGAAAIKKKDFINTDKHLVLTAPHPSPLSSYRGFFGCKHFSQTNQFLLSKGIPTIDWS